MTAIYALYITTSYKIKNGLFDLVLIWFILIDVCLFERV